MADLRNLNIEFSVDTVHCIDEGDGWGSAEPYLWVLFFKIDGDSVVFDVDSLKLRSSANPRFPPRATIFATKGEQGNLPNHDVDAGERIAVPANVGRWNTTLKPIKFTKPLLGMTQTAGMIGCITILMEEDGTPNSAIRKGYEALRTNAATRLNEVLNTISITMPEITNDQINAITKQIGDAVKRAIKDNVSVWDFIAGFFNNDDQIGSQVFRYGHRDLQKGGTVRLPFSKYWNNEGKWEVIGHITARP